MAGLTETEKLHLDLDLRQSLKDQERSLSEQIAGVDHLIRQHIEALGGDTEKPGWSQEVGPWKLALIPNRQTRLDEKLLLANGVLPDVIASSKTTTHGKPKIDVRPAGSSEK